MTLTIPSLIDHIKRGQVRIPAFQRGFVWTAEKAAVLMDSIYRGYPVGSVLVWETKETLESERDLGGITLPDPEQNYPLFYILDGQQRVTSLFATFQDEFQVNPNSEWVPIYFDAHPDVDKDETRFAALTIDQIDTRRHIRLSSLLKSSRLIKEIANIDEDYRDVVNAAVDKFNAFHLPMIKLEATTPSEDVALVFERINSTGVPLDTYQLLTAWTWSRDFDLREKFMDLAEELAPYGFGTISDDPDLLLKCCGAVVLNDARLRNIIRVSGSQLRGRMDEVEIGVKGAVDFIKSEFSVNSLGALPYASLLVPLSVFFATTSSAGRVPDAVQTRVLKQWFWRTCYGRRYSHSLDTAHAADIKGMLSLRNKTISSCWIDAPDIKPVLFLVTSWNNLTVLGKLHAIALTQRGPVSFLAGTSVIPGSVLVSGNSVQFHHIYPKKYMSRAYPTLDRSIVNSLANISIINANDNRKISSKAPSRYKSEIEPAELELISDRHLLPKNTFEDDFFKFLEDRATLLANQANFFMNQ